MDILNMKGLSLYRFVFRNVTLGKTNVSKQKKEAFWLEANAAGRHPAGPVGLCFTG